MRTTRVTLSDGLTLNVQRWGEGDRPVVLLHGLGDSVHVWRRLVRELRPRGAWIAFDLPGHGDSNGFPSRAYNVREIAGLIAGALDQLQVQRCVLVGHSLGAQVAIHLAAARPGRTDALVLIEGGPLTRMSANGAIREGLRKSQRRYLTVHDYLTELQRRLPLADEAVLADLAADAVLRHPDGTVEPKGQADVTNAIVFGTDEELTACVDSVRCPTLLVRGSWSSVMPRPAAQQLLGLLNAGTLDEVMGAGHAVALENPAGLAASLDRFLDRMESVREAIPSRA